MPTTNVKSLCLLAVLLFTEVVLQSGGGVLFERTMLHVEGLDAVIAGVHDHHNALPGINGHTAGFVEGVKGGCEAPEVLALAVENLKRKSCTH